ncbi:MAG: hypothetical protein A3J38_09245 [Gammaproteobacteria bacterium RIFCSPHIGHO2_12_FULL_45_9]|nr:MAG: hypothetical protein A3J38_09245 [Gammaproteobacteria bacterium RIFCSPHIGHO2_12_FULL_45_9]
MKPKTALKKLALLLDESSFTSQDAHLCGVSSATLTYYVKQNAIQRIARGVYRGINASTSDDFRWADLIEATQRVKGGVVCLTSALTLYELTEEIPMQHWIAISNATRCRTTLDIKVVRMRNLILGKTTIQIGAIKLSIFDKERTIVDAFRYLSCETALKALKMALTKKGTEKIDLEKIQRYAKTLRVKIEPYLIAMTI